MFGGDQRRMTPENELPQLSLDTKQLAVSDPSTLRQVGQTDSYKPNGGHDRAKAAINLSQKLQDDLHALGEKIKHHEDNVKYLKTQKNKLEESILDMQVALGKFHTAKSPISENEDLSHVISEEETIQHILRFEKSAAALVCQLKSHSGTQASELPVTKDVIGIVATLGKVDDDNLSRLLSEYLGLETMLAVVCKTFEGVRSLETYDKEGSISKSSGLHGVALSLGRQMDGRFLVICLENLRPYVGEFIPDDIQKRLDLLKPRLSNGECPPGFLGFAVNMVTIDSANLYCISPAGHGLRETLFYHLFSNLQVYKAREDMLKALPCITNGAISLDGGIIKSPGVLSLGNTRDVVVKFPKSSGKLNLPETYIEIETRMKMTKWKKDRTFEDMKREQSLLDHAKFNYETKKQEFVRFLAESSSIAQHQTRPVSDKFTPR